MTFVQVVFPKLMTQAQARVVTFVGIGGVFLFLFLMITIPATTIHHYYGNTGLWCWIAGDNVESLRLRIGKSHLILYQLALVVQFGIWGRRRLMVLGALVQFTLVYPWHSCLFHTW